MEKEFLINTIFDSIDIVCNDDPVYVSVKNDNGLALLWYHDDNTENLWEMFITVKKRNTYFNYIEDTFFLTYNKNLYTTYRLGPIEFNNQMCTCVLLEW